MPPLMIKLSVSFLMLIFTSTPTKENVTLIFIYDEIKFFYTCLHPFEFGHSIGKGEQLIDVLWLLELISWCRLFLSLCFGYL